MCTTRSGSLNGRPRKNRSLIKLKIAVFRPMPSARVSTASKVNAGDLRSWRRAKRRSIISPRSVVGDQRSEKSFGAKGDHGIDAGGAPCWEVTGDKSNENQEQCDDCKR